jgi:hypothetical protein
VRSKKELEKITAESFPYNMSDAEQDVWLKMQLDDDLPIAQEAAMRTRNPPAVQKCIKEIEKRIPEKHLFAAQATVPRPPKPWFRERTVWFWIIGTVLTVVNLVAAWLRSR